MSVSVKAALLSSLPLVLAGTLLVHGHATRAQGAPAPPAAAAAAAATPRTPDGQPDLTGFWGAGAIDLAALGLGPPRAADPSKADAVLAVPLRNGDIANLTNDNVIGSRSVNDLPVYKPQYWDKVLDDDLNGNLRDPYTSCMPPGLPRLGPPARILQTATDVVLQYSVIFQRNEVRIIPIGPRRHPVDRDGTWMGDPVAHWDGDTLVIETIGFNDQSWLGPEGYSHGYDLKVTEKLQRNGDVLTYNVTAEDPEFLQQPWVLKPVQLKLNRNPLARLEEAPPCAEHDNKHLVGKNREM